MKSCAYCGRENDDAAIYCSECGTGEFRSNTPTQLPEQPKPDPQVAAKPRPLSQEEKQQAFVTLCTCRTLEEADALATQMKVAGIDSFLPDEALMSTVGWNLNTYGFVRVKVLTEQYEAASEFLANRNLLATPVNDEAAAMSKATLPLSVWMKWVMFLLPTGFCPTLIAAAFICERYRNLGYKQRAEDASLMLLIGFLCWLLFWLAVAFWRNG